MNLNSQIKPVFTSSELEIGQIYLADTFLIAFETVEELIETKQKSEKQYAIEFKPIFLDQDEEIFVLEKFSQKEILIIKILSSNGKIAYIETDDIVKKFYNPILGS